MGKHWLIKSEPNTYSVIDLRRDKSTSWEGVRNYQARNIMRDMQVGDLALFYHSNAKPPGVAGVARVRRAAYPDPFQFDKKSKYYDPKSSKDDPRWVMVDVEFVEAFPNFVPLDTLKSTKGLENMVVIRRGRLSVQPVTQSEFGIVVKLGR